MLLHYHVSMLLFSALYDISCKIFVKYVPIKIPNISDVRIVTKRLEYRGNAYFSRPDERIGRIVFVAMRKRYVRLAKNRKCTAR